jgi:hypothetical protein
MVERDQQFSMLSRIRLFVGPKIFFQADANGGFGGLNLFSSDLV